VSNFLIGRDPGIVGEATQQNRTVPLRRPNAELRKRGYLTPAEIDKLIAAAKDGRYGQRDATPGSDFHHSAGIPLAI
jgi:hypothetical protein